MNKTMIYALAVIGFWELLVIALGVTINPGLGALVQLVLIIWIAYLILTGSVGIVQEGEQVYVLRLGIKAGVRYAGPYIIFKPIEEARPINTKVITVDLDPVDILTSDGVKVTIRPSYSSRVFNAELAALNVDSYRKTTSDMVQGGLQNVVGKSTITQVLQHRDQLDQEIESKANALTRGREVNGQYEGGFGVEVQQVWWRDLEVPKETLDALSVTASAEREANARVIAARGELQAAEIVAQAANKLDESPSGMQVRVLQMLERRLDLGNQSTVLYGLDLNNGAAASMANLVRNLPTNGQKAIPTTVRVEEASEQELEEEDTPEGDESETSSEEESNTV